MTPIIRAKPFWITSRGGVTYLLSDPRDHVLTVAGLAELITADEWEAIIAAIERTAP
jgi:hypothetical protein